MLAHSHTDFVWQKQKKKLVFKVSVYPGIFHFPHSQFQTLQQFERRGKLEKMECITTEYRFTSTAYFSSIAKKKMKHEGLNTFYSIMHTDKWQWIKGCIAKVHIWYFISLCFGLTGWACKPKHLFNAVLKCNKADRKQNNQSNKKLK